MFEIRLNCIAHESTGHLQGMYDDFATLLKSADDQTLLLLEIGRDFASTNLAWLCEFPQFESIVRSVLADFAGILREMFERPGSESVISLPTC